VRSMASRPRCGSWRGGRSRGWRRAQCGVVEHGEAECSGSKALRSLTTRGGARLHGPDAEVERGHHAVMRRAGGRGARGRRRITDRGGGADWLEGS
jgi:hypothetical protein